MPKDKENNKKQKKPDLETKSDLEPKPAKPNLESMSQTHGKLEEFKPTTLDQVWGDQGTWKYNTMDETEYRGIIEGMPKSDLLAHANKIGLIPIDDRSQLVKRLIVEFKRHVNAYRMPKVDGSNSQELSDEAQKILKEGR